MLIKRDEAICRIKKLEDAALEAEDESAARCYVRAFNAIMSCRAIRERTDGENPHMGGQQAESSRDK